MKEDRDKKNLANKDQVCAKLKRFTQIYNALYGDAMFVSLS